MLQWIESLHMLLYTILGFYCQVICAHWISTIDHMQTVLVILLWDWFCSVKCLLRKVIFIYFFSLTDLRTHLLLTCFNVTATICIVTLLVCHIGWPIIFQLFFLDKYRRSIEMRSCFVCTYLLFLIDYSTFIYYSILFLFALYKLMLIMVLFFSRLMA